MVRNFFCDLCVTHIFPYFIFYKSTVYFKINELPTRRVAKLRKISKSTRCKNMWVFQKLLRVSIPCDLYGGRDLIYIVTWLMEAFGEHGRFLVGEGLTRRRTAAVCASPPAVLRALMSANHLPMREDCVKSAARWPCLQRAY